MGDLPTVLVIEDDPDTRDVIATVLQDGAYRPVLFATASEALKHLEAATPAAIVLDLSLPLMSGWEVLAWLAKREALSGVPVIVVSGSPHLQHARSLRPSAILVEKPFRVKSLLETIRRACPHS